MQNKMWFIWQLCRCRQYIYLLKTNENKKWIVFKDSFKSFYIMWEMKRYSNREARVVNRKEHMWDSMDVTYMISKQRLVRNAWISFWGAIWSFQPSFSFLDFLFHLFFNPSSIGQSWTLSAFSFNVNYFSSWQTWTFFHHLVSW